MDEEVKSAVNQQQQPRHGLRSSQKQYRTLRQLHIPAEHSFLQPELVAARGVLLEDAEGVYRFPKTRPRELRFLIIATHEIEEVEDGTDDEEDLQGDKALAKRIPHPPRFVTPIAWALTYWISVCKRFVIFPTEIRLQTGTTVRAGKRRPKYEYLPGPNFIDLDSVWNEDKTWHDHWNPMLPNADWKEYRIATIYLDGATSSQMCVLKRNMNKKQMGRLNDGHWSDDFTIVENGTKKIKSKISTDGLDLEEEHDGEDFMFYDPIQKKFVENFEDLKEKLLPEPSEKSKKTLPQRRADDGDGFSADFEDSQDFDDLKEKLLPGASEKSKKTLPQRRADDVDGFSADFEDSQEPFDEADDEGLGKTFCDLNPVPPSQVDNTGAGAVAGAVAPPVTMGEDDLQSGRVSAAEGRVSSMGKRRATKRRHDDEHETDDDDDVPPTSVITPKSSVNQGRRKQRTSETETPSGRFHGAAQMAPRAQFAAMGRGSTLPSNTGTPSANQQQQGRTVSGTPNPSGSSQQPCPPPGVAGPSPAHVLPVARKSHPSGSASASRSSSAMGDTGSVVSFRSTSSNVVSLPHTPSNCLQVFVNNFRHTQLTTEDLVVDQDPFDYSHITDLGVAVELLKEKNREIRYLKNTLAAGVAYVVLKDQPTKMKLNPWRTFGSEMERPFTRFRQLLNFDKRMQIPEHRAKFVSWTVFELTNAGELPRIGRDIALRLYWSIVAKDLNRKMKCGDLSAVNSARTPKRAEHRHLLGPYSDGFETDIEEEDPEDGTVMWCRYKRYPNMLDGWEQFLNETMEEMRLKLNVEEPAEMSAWRKWRHLMLDHLRNKRYWDNKKARERELRSA